MPELSWLIQYGQGTPEFLAELAKELEANLTEYKLVLALAMYREALNDTAAHSDEWPPGFHSNLGELDYAAETLIRSAWEELPFAERDVLLSTAAIAVREYLVRKEGSDGP
jgi:hypothetical protein